MDEELRSLNPRVHCVSGQIQSTSSLPRSQICLQVVDKGGTSAANDPLHWQQSVFTITDTEKVPTKRALSWLKAPNSAFTFKTTINYAKRVITHGK